MSELIVRVIGRPAPQGSHERGPNGQIRHSSRYLPGWRAAVNTEVRRAYLARGLRAADMPFIAAPRPAYVHITHVVRADQCRADGTDEPTGSPDVDKLARATIDGLGDARAFTNDSQVKELTSIKVRATADSPPGAVIILADQPIGGLESGERKNMPTTPNGNYRLVLQRVSVDDETGEREWETLVEVTDTGEQLTQTWLPAATRRLGAEPGRIVAIEPDDLTTPSLTETRERLAATEKPKRTRRTKAEMEEARAETAVAPVPVPETAVAPTPDPEPETAVAAPRFNPFAS